MIALLKNRRTLAVFFAGAAVGAVLFAAYSRLETSYWRSPGLVFDQAPSLHAWALRLMELGGPGRDGSIDYVVPESEWSARGGTLAECFANGSDESIIQYELQSETLSGVYRCRIGDMTGELEVGLIAWSKNGDIDSSYEFRMLDAATAGPIEPRGVFGH